MNLEAARSMARSGRLYPAVILHGGDAGGRQAAAVELARILLCAGDEPPCGHCRNCRRVAWPEAGTTTFHPDFLVLERDSRTVTSVAATRELLRTAQLSPFEAGGQVFVIASADSLSGEAANALLKVLEEPHSSAPRHFLLLAPSRLELLPTLRSRSLSVYLGSPLGVDERRAEELAGELAGCVAAYRGSGATVHLLSAAAALARAGGWEDPRAGAPWTLAAAAVLRSLGRAEWGGELRRDLLDLAQDLLTGPELRVRGIPAQRILEGLLVRRLARPAALAPASRRRV